MTVDMLLILTPIVWLAILTLLLALCRAAADGDAKRSAATTGRPVSIGTKLVLRSSAVGRASDAGRRHPRSEPGLRRVTRQRRSAHGLR